MGYNFVADMGLSSFI